MGRLDSKVAVITGSGRGTGKAHALLFAREGASVVVNAIHEEGIKQTVAEIEAAGGKAVGCVCDVTRPEDTQRLMDTAVEKFGKLDILVNNAGLTRDALIHKMTDAQWNIVIDVHLKGVFNCIRSAAKYMRVQEHNGRIINISSVPGTRGTIGQINYSTAKSGLVGLTRTVAKEWARYGITCNVISYGYIDTRMTREKEEGVKVLDEVVGIPKKVRDDIIRRMEMRGVRFITPEEAAKPVLFLASDEAQFITCQVIEVNSGVEIYP